MRNKGEKEYCFKGAVFLRQELGGDCFDGWESFPAEGVEFVCSLSRLEAVMRKAASWVPSGRMVSFDPPVVDGGHVQFLFELQQQGTWRRYIFSFLTNPVESV